MTWVGSLEVAYGIWLHYLNYTYRLSRVTDGWNKIKPYNVFKSESACYQVVIVQFTAHNHWLFSFSVTMTTTLVVNHYILS